MLEWQATTWDAVKVLSGWTVFGLMCTVGLKLWTPAKEPNHHTSIEARAAASCQCSHIHRDVASSDWAPYIIVFGRPEKELWACAMQTQSKFLMAFEIKHAKGQYMCIFCWCFPFMSEILKVVRYRRAGLSPFQTHTDQIASWAELATLFEASMHVSADAYFLYFLGQY